MSYNNFKSTTIRGSFRNENYPDNSVKASSYFQNDVSISGQLYSNYINTNYINGLSISSIIYQIPNNINIQAGSSLINYQMLMTPIQSFGVSNIAVNNKIVWNNTTSTLQASNLQTNTINGYSMPSFFLSISDNIYNINNVNGYQNLYLNTLSSQINTTNNNLNNFITSQNNYNLNTNNYLNTISSQIYNSNISTNTYFNNYIASNDLTIKSISGNLRYLNLYTVSLSGTVNSINNQLRLTNNNVNSISGNINNINNQIININNTLTNQVYDPAYYTLNFYDAIHCYSDCILSNGLTIQTLPSYDTYYISNEQLININYGLTISSIIYNKINVSQDNTTNPLYFSFIDNFVNGAYTFRTDSGASYNPSLNSITASRFYGVHYGNVDAIVATNNYSLYSSTTTGDLTFGKNTISGNILTIGNQGLINLYGYLINIGNSNNQLNINSNNTTINSNNTTINSNNTTINSNNTTINSNNTTINSNIAINGNMNAINCNGSFNGINTTINDPVSISTNTTSVIFTKIIISANGEIAYMFSGANLYISYNSGLNWSLLLTASANIGDICCSYTGQYVYYCTSGITKPLFSSNFGSSFSSLSSFNPGPGSQKIACSYDGSVFCLVSGFSSPASYFAYVSLDFGTTLNYSSSGFTSNTKTINSVSIYGSNGILSRVMIGCGSFSNLDYAYSGVAPSSGSTITISSISALGQSNWGNVVTKSNNNYVYISDRGNNLGITVSGFGLWVSTDGGSSFTGVSYTSNIIITAFDVSFDNNNILFSNGPYFYYSSDAGYSFNYNPSLTYNITSISTSAMLKTSLVLTSTADKIYISNTNQNLIFNNDIVLPKNRLTLQSNVAYDYSNNTNIYYPYRTMVIKPSSNIINLYFPLYENYIINNLSATTVLNLPLLNENFIGLKLYITKLSGQILTVTPASPNNIFGFNTYTTASTLSIPTTVSSFILLSHYGSNTTKFNWIIISQA